MPLLSLKQWLKSNFLARGQVHRVGRTAYRSPCRPRSSFRPMLESLEDRCLPSGTAILETAPVSSPAPPPSAAHVHSPSSSTETNVHTAPSGQNADNSTPKQTPTSDSKGNTSAAASGHNTDGSPRSQTSQEKSSPAEAGSTQEHGSNNTAPSTPIRGLAIGNSTMAGTNSSADASDDDDDDDDSSNNGPASPAGADDGDADSSSNSESAPGAVTCRLGSGSSNDDDSSDDAYSNAGSGGPTDSAADQSDDPTDAEDDADDNSQDDATIEGGNPSSGDSDSDDDNTNPNGTLSEEIDWLTPDADVSLSADDSSADGSPEGDSAEMFLFDPSPTDDPPTTCPIECGLLPSLETDADWVALYFPGGPGAFEQLALILQIEADKQ